MVYCDEGLGWECSIDSLWHFSSEVKLAGIDWGQRVKDCDSIIYNDGNKQLQVSTIKELLQNNVKKTVKKKTRGIS